MTVFAVNSRIFSDKLRIIIIDLRILEPEKTGIDVEFYENVLNLMQKKAEREEGHAEGLAEGFEKGSTERDSFWRGILKEKGYSDAQISEMERSAR